MKVKKRSPQLCPRCQHPVRRVHRTTVDHLVNFVTPVKRLQCSQCGWSGAVKRQRLKLKSKPRRTPEEVIRRRVRIGLILVAFLIGLTVAIWYLTVFVWSVGPRT